ncbi:hypothetical protein Sjap_006061 [Stephania japonica]|uniref:Large ribosomal subunit protein uL18 C-terminal eukaryotes domain-containing protein n=1 Tax=Stephania japonica TaxID=461633 RepID=A0AAP0K560_9MAGN
MGVVGFGDIIQWGQIERDRVIGVASQNLPTPVHQVGPALGHGLSLTLLLYLRWSVRNEKGLNFLEVFVKAHKSRAYFKRYQVKFKRRRAGKTDYRARIVLINQDKNKYNTPKYRFVVRFTNKDIIAQIVSASIAGDLVLAAAYSHELPRYGLEAGLTNYAAAYCTGLLLARRVLKMLEMDDEYQGNVEGALDGGLDIPHSDKRFAGFKKDDKQLDAEVHRKYIFGGHVAAYMQTLNEDEPEKYQSQFSDYIKKGIEADALEAVYKKVHAAIRADPTVKRSEKQPPKEHRRYNLKKLTYEERKAKLIERLNALNSAAGADEDDEDDE